MTNRNVENMASIIQPFIEEEQILQDGMKVKKLKFKETSTFPGASSIIKRYSFGEPNQLMVRERKTILLMGATGMGKTTWINAMINYVLGVEWDDP